MHFSILTANVLTASVLLGHWAQASALPRLSDPDLDVSLKWHSTKGCRDSGGDPRDYSDGACLPLGEEARGVDILELREGCYMISYADDECTAHPRELGNVGCWKLEGKWSVKFICD